MRTVAVGFRPAGRKPDAGGAMGSRLVNRLDESERFDEIDRVDEIDSIE